MNTPTYCAVFSPVVGWWSVQENGHPVGWFPNEAYARAFATAMNFYRKMLSLQVEILIAGRRPKRPELN